MRKKSLIAAVLCCIFALALGLVGCGGGAANTADPVAESKAAFTGTWDLSGMVEDGEPVAQEDLETLESLGLDIYLELNEDGTAVLELAGNTIDGEWTPKTATEADITIEDETITMMVEGETLSMEQDGSRLEFTKRDENASASSSSSAASAAASLLDDANFKEKRDFQTYIVADDDLVRIETSTEFIDVQDDPGFIMKITNNSDIKLYVANVDGAFTVNGIQADPVFNVEIEPGASVETIMWFDHNVIGTSNLDEFVGIDGQIEVWDNETLETLGTYAFQF